MRAIQSRRVRRKEPKRKYMCDRCCAVRWLHPGRHWHTCGGWQTEMFDVALGQVLAGVVDGIVAALKAR